MAPLAERPPGIEVLAAEKIFGSGVVALRGVDLNIPSGRFVAMIGPSGCGKTTLLKMLGGLVAPSSGRILLEGLSPMVARERRLCGWVFQQPALLAWRSVLENVHLPADIMGQVAAVQTPEDLVTLVGLEGFESTLPAQLSGGMQARVAIARALSTRPRVLLMDEPFGSLDEVTRERMQSELLRIWEKSRNTVVMVTHSVSEAVFVADEVIVLSKSPGRVLKTIEVPLARPRRDDMRGEESFTRLVASLRSALEDR